MQGVLSNEEKMELLGCFAEDFNPLVTIAKTGGIDAVEKFIETYSGTKPHISTAQNFWDGLQREVRDVTIRNKFDGKNYEQIGLEFNLDPRQVRNIVHKDARPRYRQADTSRILRFRGDVGEKLEAVAEQYGKSSKDIAAVAMVIIEAALGSDLPEVEKALADAFGDPNISLFESDAA